MGHYTRRALELVHTCALYSSVFRQLLSFCAHSWVITIYQADGPNQQPYVLKQSFVVSTLPESEEST